jgi:hypothetical protein
MRRFTYFFSSGYGEPRKFPAGLYERFAGVDVSRAACPSGPGGEPGDLIAAGDDEPVYDPRAQRWIRTNGAEDLWVGVDIGAAPGPDDLVRPIQGGELLPLGDGSLWLIPHVFLFNDERRAFVSSLPETLATEKRTRLETVCAKVFQAMTSEEEIGLEFLRGGVAELLAVNYRIGRPEMDQLGLLEDGRDGRVFIAPAFVVALDFRRWAVWAVDHSGWVPEFVAQLAGSAPEVPRG